MRELIVRTLGMQDYLPVWQAMQDYTLRRTSDDPDEIWLLQHFPVYTLGLNGRPEHVLAPGTIPVVHTDRGGQVTYHGPGQLIAYTLFDLKRWNWGVRQLVTLLEQSVIELLAGYGIAARARADAPGVYVGDAKIASLGLRVRRGCSYHGLSLNIDMDLAPFAGINPCGHAGLAVTQLRDFGVTATSDEIRRHLLEQLLRRLPTTREIPFTVHLPDQ
ncbi:MAG: lipoyl(octanoyl) transferase LipB [Pseudomonadota bacterium]